MIKSKEALKSVITYSIFLKCKIVFVQQSEHHQLLKI